MSLKLTLAAERRKREAAEAEVARLRAQLEAVATPALTSSPVAAQDLADIVSQLKLTEQQLEDQQSLVRQVIDTSPNLVYVEDEQGRCILANKSYVQLLRQQDGPSRPNVKQPDAGPTPGYPRAVGPIDTSIAVSFEESFQLKDGSVVRYYTTKSPLVRTDGSRYLLTFSSDITDLKRATRVAEESVQAKQIFMANMSHEIRTPLHGVMGLAELLKKEPLSAEQNDYVQMIQYSIENLLVVINDILDFAKIESGKISLESIPFDVLKTVQDAARALTFKMDEKGLLLRIVAPDEALPLALGDPYRLHQVLVNLIGNAIKFTQRGAVTITIEAHHQADQQLLITFSVADTGIGISPDSLGEVFNSFRQADSSIPRLYGGTGLGLSICKNLVELQGGQIGVRSEPGQGSCFYFTIPYAVSEVPLIKEQPVIQQPDLLQGLNVLLAEDNAVNQLIAVSLLGQWQVQVDMAQNGEEVLQKALLQPYDLILMDIQMPRLDGIEATARLRATPGPNQLVPVIAITADAIRVNAQSCQALGFTDYLTKPYTELALYKVLAQVSQRAHTTPPPPEILAAPASRGLHYDFAMLGRLATDEGFIRKMLELFVERVPDQVRNLHEAIEQEDWVTAGHTAHGLKTTFGSLNIQPETSHLKKLEELAENRAPKAEFYPLINAVVKGTELFCALFREELARKLPTPSNVSVLH